MVAQNPLTRIVEVAAGLRRLAEDLEQSGIDPINLRYWADVLDGARAELESPAPQSAARDVS